MMHGVPGNPSVTDIKQKAVKCSWQCLKIEMSSTAPEQMAVWCSVGNAGAAKADSLCAQSLSGEPYSEDTTSLEPEGLEETGAGASGCHHPSPEEQPYSPFPCGEDAHADRHSPAAPCERALRTSSTPGRYTSQPLSETRGGALMRGGVPRKQAPPLVYID